MYIYTYIYVHTQTYTQLIYSVYNCWKGHILSLQISKFK